MLFNSQANAMTLEELLERRQQVKDCLSPLVEKSKELAVQSEIRAKNYANLSLQMISERADMYEKLKISDNDRNQFISKMKGYEAEKKALLDDEHRLYQELDAERRRVEQKENELKNGVGYQDIIFICTLMLMMNVKDMSKKLILSINKKNNCKILWMR